MTNRNDKPLKILYIVDARSPTFRNWVKHFVETGHEVRVISTYPCDVNSVPGVKIELVPNFFSAFSGIKHNGTIGTRQPSVISPILATIRSGAIADKIRAARYWLGPLELRRHVPKVRRLITEFAPDIVHAMRIPFEGMLAGLSIPSGIPLLVSIWGNDFTLHAKGTPLMNRLVRRTLKRADALHPDCERDLHLAEQLGFSLDKPRIVLPGGGGIQRNVFSPNVPDKSLFRKFDIPPGAPVIINPRGFRIGSVCNDVFFEAIPRVLRKRPDAFFICSSMAGNSIVNGWIEEHDIRQNVRLLPPVARDEMAKLFRLAMISVSPSIHDGTPNSLLEAIACGCFPVAGDVDSIREWIEDGVNGLLCDAKNPDSQADAILRALGDEKLREQARSINSKLIDERAEYESVMRCAENFYYEVINHSRAEN
jgi:glycosyltransferase involved in cell wall biosynthesis